MGFDARFVLFLSLALAVIPFSHAYNFTMGITDVPNLYEGKTGTVTAWIHADEDNECELRCDWIHYDAVSDELRTGLIDISLRPDQKVEFSLDITAKNTDILGRYFEKLKVRCKPFKEGACPETSPEELTKREYLDFYYSYLGDGVCNINRGENCTKADLEPACSCKGDKICSSVAKDRRKPDGNSCVTYCGNGRIERRYENCGNCPQDVGRCVGTTCVKGTDCESGYCVTGRCSITPYSNKDYVCDAIRGENCENSPFDCGCDFGELCLKGECVSSGNLSNVSSDDYGVDASKREGSHPNNIFTGRVVLTDEDTVLTDRDSPDDISVMDDINKLLTIFLSIILIGLILLIIVKSKNISHI